MTSEALEVTRRVVAVLEELGIDYYVGGSLASSFHGIPRSTLDADIVVDLLPGHIPPLIERLSRDFYVDQERAWEALAHRSSFNAIHLGTMFKVDLFMLKQTPLAREEMARRQSLELGETKLQFSSPEDTILEKLTWFQLGGGVSDRQWMDILGVLKVQNRRLDLDYLQKWAAAHGLSTLLEKAMREVDF
ncbi:MAG: hypothetical protein U0002_06695 [Thermoanaerobaculia bacterium]